jgi:hypothetical protein
MFETALLRKHGRGFSAVDAGLIAETMLFYSNVHIILQFSVLGELIKTIGAETLIRLVREKTVIVTYLRTDYMLFANNQGGIELHDFVAGYISGSEHGKRKVSPRDSIVLSFERALGRSSRTTKLANQFIEHIKIISDAAFSRNAKEIIDQTALDLDDSVYVQDAIAQSIHELAPSYKIPEYFRFRILRTNSGFLIDENLDFIKLNSAFKQAHPTTEVVLTPALLVVQLAEARADLFFTSRYMAELVTNAASAAIVRRRFAMLMTKRDRNASQIELFQDAQLNDARAIREAINSREHTFDEFLSILEKAKRFKDWLRDKNPDVQLLDEYYRAVLAETWATRLPGRACRFVIATGIATALEAMLPSGIGAVAGLGLEAADQLLLDRLLSGWRPNQFVEGPLQELRS